MKGCAGMDKNKSIPRFLYYSIFIIYMEVCFLLFTFGKIHWLGFITCILFSISAGLILSIITSIFNLKINKTIMLAIIGVVIFVFIAQLVYYNIYFSIISFYSIVNGTSQVMEFSGKILDVLLGMPIKILIYILPIFITVIFGLKKADFNKGTFKSKTILFLISIAVYFAGILTLFIPNSELYSPKELYYNAESPLLCSEKLGLLTAMRLDLKDQIFQADEAYNQLSETSETIAQSVEPSYNEPAKNVEYNTLNIDFDSLIRNEKAPVIKNMHRYFQSAESTNKNDYTGLFKGKNLILVLAESFSPMVIDKNLTPTLYKMQNEGFKFTDFYTPIWPISTSDGEYVTCTSLVPKEGVWSMKKSSSISLPFTMGNLMKNSGYSTFCYHDHTYTYYGRNLSHPNMGYQVFKAVGNGLKINSKIWPESDLEMINAS
ncbi:MAG: sulfatase-like hydrolase/transferase, partial [Clostridiaceae bacterium]